MVELDNGKPALTMTELNPCHMLFGLHASNEVIYNSNLNA